MLIFRLRNGCEKCPSSCHLEYNALDSKINDEVYDAMKYFTTVQLIGRLCYKFINIKA